MQNISFYGVAVLKFIVLIALIVVNTTACNMVSDSSNLEITSKCTLNGAGDYECVFSNKDKKEGSLCEHIILSQKDGGDKLLFIPGQENIIEASAALMRTHQTLVNIIKKDLKNDERKAELKRTYNKLVLYTYGAKGLAISEEICSGLIKAGDIREVSGRVSFGSNSPVKLCLGDSWMDACSFSTVSSNQIKKEIDAKLNE